MCLDKLKQAFSIFELSIVIIILGFISINFISIIDSLLKIDKIKITNGKIAKIEEAIIVYYDKNSYLPCPDSFNIRNDKKFNKNSNYNSALSAKCLGANKIRVDNKLTAFYGSIPVDVLNLPIEYKFDGWNNQFSLIVAANYISQEFELALDKLKESSFPIIYNKSGATEILYKYNNIAFLIISYGQNGFGAYNKLGRKNDFNSSTIEADNLDNIPEIKVN